MARALERWLPEREEEVAAQPRYLNQAAMDSPDSANAAVRREVWHLFDQAFVILSHGLHLHRENIRQSDDLEAMINNSRERIDIDIGNEGQSQQFAIEPRVILPRRGRIRRQRHGQVFSVGYLTDPDGYDPLAVRADAAGRYARSICPLKWLGRETG